MSAVEMVADVRERAEYLEEATEGLRIVVASDGSEASDAALRAAQLIAAQSRVRVYVLSVVEPIPVMVPMPDALLVPADFDDQRAQSMREAMERQRARFDKTGSWTTELRFGRPAEVIARFAREHGAGLVIVGANKHNLLGRILGEETAMELARLIDVPLFVASHDMLRLPKRVLISMDIKPFGLEPLAGVLTSVSDTKTVSCLHVKPRAEFMGVDWAEFDREYEVALQERFAVLDKSLTSAGARPDLIVRHGDVTRELIDYADHSRAELVVVGVNRKRGRARAVSGRLAGRIVRHIDASVLIVPGMQPEPVQFVTRNNQVTDVLRDSSQWGVAMKAFTARNAGRVCTLEVDDPDMGALVEARSYPLVGVDYDRKDGRLTIGVGDTRGTEKHLTRSVPSPDSISILSKNGRDAAMSVVHGAGQTLLTF